MAVLLILSVVVVVDAGQVFELTAENARRNAGFVNDLVDDETEEPAAEAAAAAVGPAVDVVAREKALTAMTWPLRRIFHPRQANKAMAIACLLMNIGSVVDSGNFGSGPSTNNREREL